MLGGLPWPDEDVASFARREWVKSDYVAVTHLKPITSPWTVELRLIRRIDARCLATLTTTFPPDQPEQAPPDLV